MQKPCRRPVPMGAKPYRRPMPRVLGGPKGVGVYSKCEDTGANREEPRREAREDKCNNG